MAGNPFEATYGDRGKPEGPVCQNCMGSGKTKGATCTQCKGTGKLNPPR